MDFINKSGASRGRKAANDTNNKKSETPCAEGRYETAVGRGIYSVSDWPKARAYAVPYAAREASRATASIVFMVRIPGSLAK
eukprot:9046562-Lingulodinium_polyedra.AAC.1